MPSGHRTIRLPIALLLLFVSAGAAADFAFETDAVRLLVDDRARALSLSGPHAINATLYPEFGIKGQKVALVAVPTERRMDTIRALEKAFDRPSPTIDGQWVKHSDAVRTSYLFIDLTAWSVDQVIRYANLGGFKYILIYAATWASSRGSYPIKRKNFPLGERSLKRVVDSYVAWMKPGSTAREEDLDCVAPRALAPSPVRPAQSGSEPRSAIGRNSIRLRNCNRRRG